MLAIVPLAALLSHATESVAAKTGDTVGGLLNATLGNLTELVIALTALSAGQYTLVKASIAGAIVTNTLFMLGASFLLGGLRHHVQEYNRVNARLQASLLFLATIALLVPSAIKDVGGAAAAEFTGRLSVGLSLLLITAYALSALFSLKTHPELFASAEHGGDDEEHWPIGVALVTLAVVTVLVALVSEVFVESVQEAATTFGMTPAFVGFIVVALVGAAAEMASAFSAARKNRLDLSVGIALGSASQIALFVAPVLVLLSYVLGPAPMDLRFWPGAVVMMLVRNAHCRARHQRRSIDVVRRNARADGVSGFRDDPLPAAAVRAIAGRIGARAALFPLRPGGPGTIGHVQRREDSQRLDRVDERPAALFKGGNCVGPERSVLFVDDDLAPVFDDDVSGRAVLVAKEGTAKIRPRVAIHRSPFALDSV